MGSSPHRRRGRGHGHRPWWPRIYRRRRAAPRRTVANHAGKRAGGRGGAPAPSVGVELLFCTARPPAGGLRTRRGQDRGLWEQSVKSIFDHLTFA
jgi:hypothetical protein